MKRITSIAVLIGGIIWLMTARWAFALPAFETVCGQYRSSDALLLDRNGALLHEFRINPRERKCAWTALSDISPALVRTVIQSEDRRFFSHSGVDWAALAGAVLDRLFRGGHRGASTISMQLSSLIDETLKLRQGEKTLSRKWLQMRTAWELERTWTKNQILEAYLNLVGFRGELRGIGAISYALFGKAPSGLNTTESALIAALIPAPNTAMEKIARRTAAIAASVDPTMSQGDTQAFAINQLSRPFVNRPLVALAPHVAQRLTQPEKPVIQSTLVADIQKFSSEVLLEQVSSLSKAHVSDGAALVVDNESGDVLAYVGNIGPTASSPHVDGVVAPRQAGSTLKPFLYAEAFDRRLLTAASRIDDTPIDILTATGIYQPENYDREFRGPVTARVALAASLNIPAVKSLSLVGVKAFVDRLKSIGFGSLEASDYYGLSLALGSADVTLWELVNAYRSLANGGEWRPLRLSLEDEPRDSRQIYDNAVAFIVSDILSDREARSTTFSLENPLSTRFWTAVKTGTSKDMRDNWCVGYSRRFTVGVWVGNFSGEPMRNVSGVSGAAPVWLEIMNYLHRNTPIEAPKPPAGLIAKEILNDENGLLVSRREWFIHGTAPDRLFKGPIALNPRLLYPAPDTLIAIDPDIPDDLQRVFFRASTQAKWILDGALLGSGRSLPWRPTLGRHTLLLVGPEDCVAARIGFEVR